MERDFEVFFKMHEQRIHYQIYRLNTDESLRGELYSEGILALWGAYKSFQPNKGNLGTYLNYQIRNRMIDLLRKKIRDQQYTEQVQKDEIINIYAGNRLGTHSEMIFAGTDIELKDDAFWQLVRRRLTDSQWKWVQYFIIADLTVKEIAEIEDVSGVAVKSWGREARRRLRVAGVFERLQALM